MGDYRTCQSNLWRRVACHVTVSSASQLGRMIVQMSDKEEKGEKEMNLFFNQNWCTLIDKASNASSKQSR